MQYRPIPFYFITTTDPDALSQKSAEEALQKLKDDGFGGFVLFNKPPHGFSAEEYLGPAWFDMVRHFVLAAKKLELDVWINDGFDYPPGNAAGRINPEKYPHLTPQRLVLKDGRAQAEPVDWGFPAFEEPGSAEAFHEIVYEAYRREVGEFFGSPIRGFFSDADNRRVNYKVFGADPRQKDYFPWATDFAEGFAARYGYDLTPYLTKILQKTPCEQAGDYWEYAGALYQSWFASNYRWCREHGLSYTFHTSDSAPFAWRDAPRSSAFTEGRALDMGKNSDYPGTDQELREINGGKHMRIEEYWTPRVSWGGDAVLSRNPGFYGVWSDLRTKQASSAAFLHRKKGTMCEMFAASNWGVTPTELRQIAAWQIMQGVTFPVTHAVHHRLFGQTKYFAPPVFDARVMPGLRELNDWIAERVTLAASGELIAPIAVLDLTDAVWEDRADAGAYFDLCEELNRLPYGYVIADAASIKAREDAFSVVLCAGEEPFEGRQKEILGSLSIPVLKADEIGRLDALVNCGVRYFGEGTPHFMRRRLADGTELVLIGNIEHFHDISGTLFIGKSLFDLTLFPGQIAAFTEAGPVLLPRQPGEFSEKTALQECVPVTWEKENLVPLEYFENEAGEAITKQNTSLYFRFFVTEGAKELTLLTPCASIVTALTLDGRRQTRTKQTRVFDEAYDAYVFDASEGEHVLHIEAEEPFAESDRLLLTGEFGVDVQAEEPFALRYASQYCLDRFLPAHACVTLTKRQDTLSTKKSWAEQGHPFYSGEATYQFAIQSDFSRATLVFPALSCACTVEKDGEIIAQGASEPYEYDLGALAGKHVLRVRVQNTSGNAMECYRAPSGITQGAYLAQRKQ